MHARVREGVPEAFRDLFDAHARLVHGYAARWTGDRALAEDVVSPTFLEPGGCAGACGTRGRTRARGRGASPSTCRATRRAPAAVTRPRSPGCRSATASRTSPTRWSAGWPTPNASRLRPGDREVFVLCVWSPRSHAEAASALGIREGAVRTRLFRALARLRRPAADETARERVARPGQLHGDRPYRAVRSSAGTSR